MQSLVSVLYYYNYDFCDIKKRMNSYLQSSSECIVFLCDNIFSVSRRISPFADFTIVSHQLDVVMIVSNDNGDEEVMISNSSNNNDSNDKDVTNNADNDNVNNDNYIYGNIYKNE